MSALISDLHREVARGWVARLASGDITEAQMLELRRWLAEDSRHQAAFAHEKASWRQMGPARERLAGSLRLPLAGVLRPAQRARSIARLRGVAWASSGLLAVCLILVALFGNPLIRLRADYATGVGQVATIQLPDGSTAILNTDTAIAVSFQKGARQLSLLKGEAWFDVKSDRTRPFRVDAGSGVAEAVGTAFSVARREDGMTVRVTEGVVALGRRAGNEAIHIRAGMQVSTSTSRTQPSLLAFDPDIALAWRDRRVVIEDQTLSSALNELDRYRRGGILLLAASHADTHVSGTLSLDRLDHGIEGLASTQGLAVTHVTPYLAIVH